MDGKAFIASALTLETPSLRAAFTRGRSASVLFLAGSNIFIRAEKVLLVWRPRWNRFFFRGVIIWG